MEYKIKNPIIYNKLDNLKKNKKDKYKKNERILLSDILDLDEFQKIQDGIAYATNVACVITDPEGNPVTKPSNYSQLYDDNIRDLRNTTLSCILPVNKLKDPHYGPLLNLGDNGVFRYGYIKMIMFDQRIADWFIGQVRVDNAVEENILAYIRETGAEKKAFLSWYNKLPAMPEKQFSNILDMINILSISFSNSAYKFHECILESEKLIEMKKALRESERKYMDLYNNALVAMFTAKAEDGRVIEANDLGYEMFGYSSRDELVGKLSDRNHYKDPEFRDKLFKEILDKGELKDIEAEFRRKDGSVFWGKLTARYYPDQGLIDGVIIDITKNKQAEEKITRLIFYDRLTGLPNKSMLNNHLQMEIAQSRKFAVICLGVDRFKRVNDIYGKSTGDLLLKNIALKLPKLYFKKDIVSRYESDKFIILLSDIVSENDEIKFEDIEKIIQKTLTHFSSPIMIENYSLEVTASIGVCLYPVDGSDVDSLIQNSESAMYVAKQKGGNTWHFFDAKLNEQMMDRFRLENELKQAIKNNEFIPYYQPKVNKFCEIIGLEALVRWKPSKRSGLILPHDFIPVVEKNGMIVDIGNSIFRQTFTQIKNWHEQGYPPVPVSINISSYQFKQEELLSTLRKLLAETGLDPKLIELEITETGIMENQSESIEKLNEIHEMGIKISIDDFGTGYSSLSKLKACPIDIVKIDKSFINDLPSDKTSVTIVTTIIDLAHNLGFKVVAEGVETPDQFEFLKILCCDYFQGYYFNEPMPANNIAAYMEIKN